MNIKNASLQTTVELGLVPRGGMTLPFMVDAYVRTNKRVKRVNFDLTPRMSRHVN